MADLVLNMKPFERLVEAVDKAGDAASSAPLGIMFTKWGARYMTFTRREFMRNSRGGGDWPKIKRQTARRRKGPRRSRKGKKRRHSILIQTRTLFNALSPGMTGNLNQRIRRPGGIRVGFSGAQHNNDGITIRELAIIHDQGLGNNPERVILKEPDSRTINGMMRDAAVATKDMMSRLEI